MVRKTTARVKNAAKKWYDTLISHEWSFADVITKSIEFIQEYWMTTL